VASRWATTSERRARKAAKAAHRQYCSLYAKGYRNATPAQRSAFKVQKSEYFEEMHEEFVREDAESEDEEYDGEDKDIYDDLFGK